MHNLHLGVVKADSPEEACKEVESRLSDWGDENNWRTICGCVSDKNEVYVHDEDGRWSINDEELDTIEKLNKLATSWITVDAEETKEMNDMMTAAVKGKTLESCDWYKIEQYAHDMRNAQGRSSINVLEDELNSWEFSDNGVTNFGAAELDQQQYVVLIDMHS